MNISLSSFTPENFISRDGFGRLVLLQLAHSLHPPRLNLVLTVLGLVWFGYVYLVTTAGFVADQLM